VTMPSCQVMFADFGVVMDADHTRRPGNSKIKGNRAYYWLPLSR
jgi:hypothetical protein